MMRGTITTCSIRSARLRAATVPIMYPWVETRIDINQSEQLAAAAQAAGAKVTTWFLENGEHVQTPAAYPQEFEQRLVGFFRENLGQQERGFLAHARRPDGLRKPIESTHL